MIAFDHLHCYHYLCFQHINNHNHNTTIAATLSTVLTQHQHNPSKQHLYKTIIIVQENIILT